jgi:hypothetical protein
LGVSAAKRRLVFWEHHILSPILVDPESTLVWGDSSGTGSVLLKSHNSMKLGQKNGGPEKGCLKLSGIAGLTAQLYSMFLHSNLWLDYSYPQLK